MTNDRDDDGPPNVFDTLLTPLRLPGRVVSDIETVASAVVALQSDAKKHLSSVDKRSGELVEGLRELQGSIDRIEGRVDKLEKKRMEALLEATENLQASIGRIEGRVEDLATLEESITARMDGVRSDLNDRMVAVEKEVRSMLPWMEEMAQDVKKIEKLLPDPGDGPLTRLKDTLTQSS